MTVATELSSADVERAAEELRGHVRETPALRCPAFEDRVGAELWLKAENLQWIGAFKARGALLNAGRLSAEERAAGLVTYSSGNHAQAVALAANRYGVRATIAMPEDAPAVKVAAVRALGADILFAGTTSPERKAVAETFVAEHGGSMIEPFDHPNTICGQGTATLELFAQVERETGGSLDAVVVPVGGGGLIAGACLVASEREAEVHAVEPVGCDSLGQSIAAGEIVPVSPGPTLADGLKPTRVGELNFHIAKSRVSACHTVVDDEIGKALVELLFAAKLLVEPSGAAALAWALRGELSKHNRVGVLLSGGNADPAVITELLNKHQP